MLPQYACNLAAASNTDKRAYLDWDLHITAGWEQRIPFCVHIYQDTAATSPQQLGSSFPQFNRLPAELQVQVLQFCTPNTLFNARQASSAIRAEASKLLWADLDTYFIVPAHWVLEGGYPGYAWWDTSFQDYVQNVEIEYHSGTDRAICPRTDGKTKIRQDQITAFWNTFRQRFPSAKRVVINLNARIPTWWEDAAPVPLPLRALVYACPLNIEVFALVLEERIPLANTIETKASPKTKWQRSLYRPGAGSKWEIVKLGQLRKTVLMPPKQFSGPVGKFQQLEYKVSKTSLRRGGLWLLMVEAVGQHYFGHRKDSLRSCPSYRCDASFANAREWVVHAAELHCQEWSQLDIGQLGIVPDSVRATFEERQRMLAIEDEEASRQHRETKDAWKEDDGERRGEIEQGWLAQLHSDQAWHTGAKPRDSKLWIQFLQQMSPTWDGFYED